jgi:hypothetical protein
MSSENLAVYDRHKRFGATPLGHALTGFRKMDRRAVCAKPFCVPVTAIASRNPLKIISSYNYVK